MPQIESDPGYSRAFERFVTVDGDVSGLIGYALYKRNIRQRRVAGQATSTGAERDPAPAEQQAYRLQPNRLLQAVAADAVGAAEASMVERAVVLAQRETAVALIAEIRARTGLGASIITGVVVWLVTVALTVLLALAEPDWVRNLVEHVQRAG